MIQRVLARKLFIAVNNPWLCSINDDPLVMAKDFEDIIKDKKLTDNLQIHTDFRVVPSEGTFPKYEISLYLEAVGTTTAINLGRITELSVKDMELIMKIRNNGESYTIKIPAECEDLDGLSYKIKKKDFEIGGRLR